jgi:hypothetical protein
LSSKEGDAIQVKPVLAEVLDANCTGREVKASDRRSIQGNNEVICILLAKELTLMPRYNDGRTALIGSNRLHRPETVDLLAPTPTSMPQQISTRRPMSIARP